MQNPRNDSPIEFYYASSRIDATSAFRDSLLDKGFNLPDEISNSSLKRQCEFLAGRFCANSCLKQFGFENPQPLTIKESRAPDWPVGVVGSISHCDDKAVAIVADETRTRGIGIDIEPIMSEVLAERIRHRIIAPEEALYGHSDDFKHFLTLAFSAKEALYKALFQQLKSALRFEDFKIVAINAEKQCIHIQNKTVQKRGGYKVQYSLLDSGHLQTLAAL